MANKIVITGASGHIGYHVSKQLLGLGHDVSLLIRKENPNTDDLKSLGAKIHFVNLLQPVTYEKLLKNADVLFHLASENTTETKNEERIIENTFGLTKTVLEAAIEMKVKTIIYTSSVVVLGRSSDKNILINEKNKTGYFESPYVKGKFLAEDYCDQLIRNSPVDIRRLYPSWVIGKNDVKLTPPHRIIKNYVKNGQRFYFKGGISVASVDEVAKAHVNAWLIGKPNEKYVVAGENISFRDFYELLARHSGKKIPGLFIPKWILYSASLAGKIILGNKNPVDPRYVKSVIGNYSWYDSGKAKKELGYDPPASEQILKAAVTDAKKSISNLNGLVQKKNPQLQRTRYDANDVLLITGFPGWLGNRMVDVFMNGDRNGKYAVERKIRLLVQPQFKGLISLPSNFEVVYGDITDPSSLKNVMNDVKAVYHLAGVIYPKKINDYYAINHYGTRNIVDACIENGVRRIVSMGTDSICGYGKATRIFDENTPPTPYKNYGWSKYLGEKYLLDKSNEGLIEGTSLRCFWFFGPFIPERNMNFFKMFYWKKQLVFGNGKNYRSISHVDNIIQAFVKAEKRKETIGKWYWVAGKKSDCVVDEIYSHIAEAMDVAYRPLYIPKLLCELLGMADHVLGWFGKVNASIHAAGKFHKDIAGDIGAAERDFEYHPEVGFKEIKQELKQLIQHDYSHGR